MISMGNRLKIMNETRIHYWLAIASCKGSFSRIKMPWDNAEFILSPWHAEMSLSGFILALLLVGALVLHRLQSERLNLILTFSLELLFSEIKSIRVQNLRKIFFSGPGNNVTTRRRRRRILMCLQRAVTHNTIQTIT